MKQFTANENDTGVRLSRFVQRVTNGLPESVLYKSFRNKRVKVNGKRGTPEYRIQAGDIVQLYINDEFFSQAERVRATAVPFSIVWENECIAVLYKPSGVLSHSDSGDKNTLLDAFVARLAETGAYDPALANGFTPALSNRLDRGTEGLVLGAKTYAALRDANALIQQGLLHKSYLCITVGVPPQGLHTGWLRRDKERKTVQVTPHPQPGAKTILTEISVRDTACGLALCEVGLITGRTHQIRAHLAFLGTPVLGDKKYGSPAHNKRYGLNTQALCAWQLAFDKSLPDGSALAPLAGQSFSCKAQAQICKQWDGITK